jgi:TonB family protein
MTGRALTRLACVGLPLLALATSGAAFAGQESVQSVRQLYAAAEYEQALAAADKMARQPAIEQYRVFSLTALGRQDEAQKVMEALIEADPTYVLDPEETPPRVQQAFDQVRQRLLPEVAKRLYVDARAALERKERANAIARFERLLTIIDGAGPAAPAVEDLRMLASGFLDLSKALAELPRADADSAARTPPPPPVESPATRTPAAADTETPPVAINQQMPPWLPPDSQSRRGSFSGVVRVRIGADGRVEDAEILSSIHMLYDPVLLRAARNWVYQPARRNGVPIASEVNVQVNLAPER